MTYATTLATKMGSITPRILHSVHVCLHYASVAGPVATVFALAFATSCTAEFMFLLVLFYLCAIAPSPQMQARRVYEILRLQATNMSHADQGRQYRLMIKERLNRPFQVRYRGLCLCLCLAVISLSLVQISTCLNELQQLSSAAGPALNFPWQLNELQPLSSAVGPALGFPWQLKY